MPFDTAELKNRVDLAGYLTSRGFTLTKRGQSLVMPCPFHKEEKPSFSVSPARQLFHCFGCGVGGDAISFVERFDKVDFKIALARLAHFASSSTPPTLGPASATPPPLVEPALPAEKPAGGSPSAARRSRAARPLETVVSFWQKTFAKTPDAQEYLRSRGLTDAALLAACRAGYSDGTLRQRLASKAELASQLTQLGCLNTRGNDFFYKCLIFPILDSEGVIVGVYGRNTRPETKIPHLYLRGPRKGVFNYPGLKGSNGSAILTEGVLDALSLLQLGFPNTSCVWGTNGFTADILGALQRTGIKTVFVTYDNDHAGNPAAEQLAYRLAPHGIATRKVELPEKDPNAFLLAGHTHADFAALLERAADLTPDQARPVKPSRPATTAKASSSSSSSSAPSPKPEDSPVVEDVAPPLAPEPTAPFLTESIPELAPPATPEGSGTGPSLVTRFGPRTYRLTPPRPGSSGLRVTLRLEIEGKSLLDRFDLASDRSRSSFVTRATGLFPAVDRHYFEEDLFALVDELERRQLKKEVSDPPLTPKVSPMSESQEAAARSFLMSPTLIADLMRDLEGAGLVGEVVNKLLLYLIATSRLLEHPLSAVFLSGSSAGKSHLIKGVASLMPPESLFSYTRISAAALFYKEKDALKHKLIVIEEAEGASDADYPLRVMQSDRTLTNLVTVKDPVTGQMTTQETQVEGPISLLVSSTAAAIHYENATRSFELAVDESSEQTERILAAQRDARTLAGLAAKVKCEAIRTRHHNAQRLLAPVAVVNNYAPLLSFPAAPLRLRREHEKYLSLIEAVTFLHQHQRRAGTLPGQGHAEPRPYVETTKADIRVANRLFAAVMPETVGELSRQSRVLLAHIRGLLANKRKEAGSKTASKDSPSPASADPLFESPGLTRREIREALNWSDYQLRICLEQLEDLEYVITENGRQGKRYVFALTPKGLLAARSDADPDELARAFGLTDPDTLPDELP